MKEFLVATFTNDNQLDIRPNMCDVIPRKDARLEEVKFVFD